MFSQSLFIQLSFWTSTLQHIPYFLIARDGKLWIGKSHTPTHANNKFRTCVNSQNRIGKTYIKHPAQPHQHLSTREKLLPFPRFSIPSFIPHTPFYITQQFTYIEQFRKRNDIKSKPLLPLMFFIFPGYFSFAFTHSSISKM